MHTPLAIHIALLSPIDYTVLLEKAMVRILLLIHLMPLTWKPNARISQTAQLLLQWTPEALYLLIPLLQNLARIWRSFSIWCCAFNWQKIFWRSQKIAFHQVFLGEVCLLYEEDGRNSSAYRNWGTDKKKV